MSEGYKIEVCRALLEEQTIAGVQREVFIAHFGIAITFILLFRMLYTIPIFLCTYHILYRICKKDPLVLKIFFKKYIKQRDYFFFF